MTAYVVTYVDWTCEDDNELILGYYCNYCRVKHAIMKHASKYMNFSAMRAVIPETMPDNYIRIIMDERHDYIIEEIHIE